MDPRVFQKLTGVQMSNWADVMVFLDLFIQQAPYLERDALEKVLPYALLRSMYNEVYKTRDGVTAGTVRSKKKEDADGI